MRNHPSPPRCLRVVAREEECAHNGKDNDTTHGTGSRRGYIGVAVFSSSSSSSGRRLGVLYRAFLRAREKSGVIPNAKGQKIHWWQKKRKEEAFPFLFESQANDLQRRRLEDGANHMRCSLSLSLPS